MSLNSWKLEKNLFKRVYSDKIKEFTTKKKTSTNPEEHPRKKKNIDETSPDTDPSTFHPMKRDTPLNSILEINEEEKATVPHRRNVQNRDPENTTSKGKNPIPQTESINRSYSPKNFHQHLLEACQTQITVPPRGKNPIHPTGSINRS